MKLGVGCHVRLFPHCWIAMRQEIPPIVYNEVFWWYRTKDISLPCTVIFHIEGTIHSIATRPFRFTHRSFERAFLSNRTDHNAS